MLTFVHVFSLSLNKYLTKQYWDLGETNQDAFFPRPALSNVPSFSLKAGSKVPFFLAKFGFGNVLDWLPSDV